MVIKIVNFISIALFKYKSNAPIARHFHRPSVLRFRFQLMNTGTWKSHVLDSFRYVQKIKNLIEPVGMLRTNPFFAFSLKEVLESFMSEAHYHLTSITYGVTLSKIIFNKNLI